MKKNCYRRKDGRWQYKKIENGILYYTIANTYRELIEKIKNIKPRKIKEVKREKQNGQTTLIQYFSTFYTTYIETKKINEKTKKSWQNTLEHYIKPNFQRIPLEKLTTEQIQIMINKIELERTRQVIFQRITRVLRRAYATGKIKRDITLGLEKPTRKQIQERTPLKFEEQKQIIDSIKGTDVYLFYMFSVIVGSRRSETVKFDISKDLNENEGIIHIRGTKTEKSDRNVYVTPKFIELLKENGKDKPFSFNGSYYTHKISEVFKKLNINNCLHGLRHTCSANLHFLGASDKYRQMQLGHSSIVTTNDIYTNIKENIPKAKLRELYGDLYPQF